MVHLKQNNLYKLKVTIVCCDLLPSFLPSRSVAAFLEIGKPSKVFVCGLKGVGKTTMLEQLIYNNLEEQDIHPTIEDIYVASIETDRGTKEIHRFYDTEGVGLFENADVSLPKSFYSIAEAFVLVYSVESRQSFDVVEALKKEIDKNKEKREIITIVIGLSRKQDEDRQVEPAHVAGWIAREKVKHFECCVSNRQSLFPPFVYIASKITLAPVKTPFVPLGMVTRKQKDLAAHSK